MAVKLPPLCVLLLHLGACPESIAWAARRPIAESSLAECPEPAWRSWLAQSLAIDAGSDWPVWSGAASAALLRSGYGSGDGYGSGYGSGYGDGKDVVNA